jgi:hypothetical protein
MRKTFQRIAAGSALLCLLVWLALGPNLGWTKTSVVRWEHDPITELDGPVIEDRFIPGVELLAAALFGAAVLFGASLFIPANKTKTTQSQNTKHSVIE